MSLVHKSAVGDHKDSEMSTLIRYHQCYACQKIIKHDYKTIYNHLLNHKIGIEDYVRKYCEEIRKELRDKGMSYVIEKEEELKNSPSVEEYLKNKEAEDQKLGSSEERIMEEWYDWCEFKCSICSKVVSSNLKFHTHIVRQHKLKNMKEYRSLHGNPEVVQRLHECNLCGNNVKWEASRIRDHLKNAHKMQGKLVLQEYGVKYRDRIAADIQRLATDGSSEKLPMKFGHFMLGGTKKGFSPKEWKDLYSRKSFPDDRVICRHCGSGLNRSSLYKHIQRYHPLVLEPEGGQEETVPSDVPEVVKTEIVVNTLDDETKTGEPRAEICHETPTKEKKSDETVLEEVVLEEDGGDFDPEFVIDQVSGEILLLNSTDYTTVNPPPPTDPPPP